MNKHEIITDKNKNNNKSFMHNQFYSINFKV